MWVVPLCLVVGAGCQEAARSLGPTPADARRNADDAFRAIALRFGPVELEPAFAAFRPRVARASFVPSWVYGDAALWPELDGDARAAAFRGEPGDATRYRVGLRRDAPPPGAPGEYRGRLRLTRLAAGEFEWAMREELSIGRVAAAEAASALTATLAAIERAPASEARERWREALPRTAEALGRAFVLERLHLVRDAGGATTVLAGAALQPRALAQRGFPAYARFLDKYASPMRFRLQVSGEDGARWWELQVHDGRWLFNARLRQGSLAPLDGSAQALPARLRARIDYSTRAGLFRVGFAGLMGDVGLVREAHEKAFVVTFRAPPDWQLPFVLQPFLKASLRRPFEGQGALLAYGLRDAPGGPSLLVRDYRIAVKESWIVRWLGGLAGTAVTDFRGSAEGEADRFSGEALEALRQDLIALAQP